MCSKSILTIIWCFNQLAYVIEANHFRGGYISWQLVTSNSSNSSMITINIQQTYWWTYTRYPCNGVIGDSGTFTCLSLSCSNFLTSMTSVQAPCISSDVGLDISTAYSSTPVTLLPGSRFVLGYRSNAWVPLVVTSTLSYGLTMLIDLNVRNDNTSRINSSPVSTMAPIVTVRPNVPQALRIPLFDIDSDIIKCRWANSSAIIDSRTIDECSGACLNIPGAQLTSSSTLANNCSLTFTATTAGYYVAALQIEDFMPSAPNGPPLSSIPLQFVIECINTNCSEPNITGQVSNGATVLVTVNQPFVTTIFAQAGCNITTINRFLTIIKPENTANISNITSLGSSLYSITFTWTPNAGLGGTTQLYCTMALDTNNLQSAQYCINFVVTFPTTTSTTTSTTTTTSVSPSVVYVINTVKEEVLSLPWILGLGVPLLILGGITGALVACKFCSTLGGYVSQSTKIDFEYLPLSFRRKASSNRTFERLQSPSEYRTISTAPSSTIDVQHNDSILLRTYAQQNNAETLSAMNFRGPSRPFSPLQHSNSILSSSRISPFPTNTNSPLSNIDTPLPSLAPNIQASTQCRGSILIQSYLEQNPEKKSWI